jgi:hypothetical protein
MRCAGGHSRGSATQHDLARAASAGAAVATGWLRPARIAALAAGGEILASAETAATVGIPYSAPRTVELKGVPEPVEIVSIDWR